MKELNEAASPTRQDVIKASRATHARGLALIQGVLSPNGGAPVLGLYVYLSRLRTCNAGLQVTECIREGWVRRVVSNTDRRKYTLHITPAGQRMLAELVPIIAKHEGNLGSALTRAERSLLKELLAKLIAGRTLS